MVSRSVSAPTRRALVISGSKATLESNRTINGSGKYNFLESGINGSQTGVSNLIRMQITNQSNYVIYNTQAGAAGSADPSTALTNGKIKIH